MENPIDKCPWCGSMISRIKFLDIEARIREEEKARLKATESTMRKTYEEKYRKETERQTSALAQQVKTLQVQSAAKQKQLEMQAAAREKALQEQLAVKHKNDIGEARQIFAKERDQALLRKDADLRREREGFQKKIKELERQVEKKTSNDLGEGAEIDLYESLREAFPDDRIERIKKGQPGADIDHEVLYKGISCGRILYDSKNRDAWQNAFAIKLHDDKINQKAEHAILSTTVFPSGKKELCIEDDVIVTNPARVVHLVSMLREGMVKMQVRGLSLQERSGKVNQLYQFITSDRCSQLFAEATRLTDDIQELDVQEVSEHQKTWKNRGRLTSRLRNIVGEIDTEIYAIVAKPVHQTAEVA